MRKLLRNVLATLFLAPVALATTGPGSLFTYEGVLSDTTGTPMTGTKTVVFQIYLSSCELYSETQSVTLGSSGEFSVIIGAGNRQDSTGNTADRIFASSGSVSCEGAAATTVSGFAERSLHIQVNGEDLYPDITIGNIPFAINAQRLADKAVSDFVLKTDVSSTAGACNSVNSFLTWDAANMRFGCSSVSGLASGTVTSVTVNSPLTVTTPNTTPVISINQANTSTSGFLSYQDWNAFNTKMSASLSSGNIWVGNAANAPTAVTITGDATLSPAGALTLSSTGVTAGTYGSPALVPTITVDAKGRITAASNTTISLPWAQITSKPATLAGYGITDSVVMNNGGTPGIQTGTDASKPASPTAGSIYFATDTQKIYQYNSGAWMVISSAIGAGGTITGVTAGTGLSGGGTVGNVTLNLANTAVTAGSFNRANITVDAQGRITAATNGSSVNLASEVTGALPIANGGTGATTAATAFNALSPLTTKGDILVRDTANNIRLPAGTDGQVLSADSTQAAGLKWVNPSPGTVTAVTGTAPISVTTGTSTPVISVSPATASSLGVVQVGAGIAVSSGTISADPNNFPSLVPLAKGGTGANSFSAFSLIASNSAGTSLTSVPGTVNGSILQYSATGPVFSAASYPSTISANQLLYGTGTNTVGLLTPTANSVFTINGSGLPVFQNLGSDIFPQYAMVSGRSGGQTLNGGTAAGNTLTLYGSTAGGNIYLNPAGGSVGIGTTTPAYPLQVANGGTDLLGLSSNNTAGTKMILANSDTGGATWQIASSGSAGPGTAGSLSFVNQTGSLNALNITSAGNVGIGTANPISPLHIASTTTTSQALAAYLKPNLATSNNTSLIIGKSGTTAGAASIAFTLGSTASTSYINLGLFNSPTVNISGSGDMTVPGCVAYNGGTSGTCLSDLRVKDHVRPFESGLNSVLGLNPVYYRYNGLGGTIKDDKDRLGVIAQTTLKVAPEIVEKRMVKLHPDDKEDTEINVVNYSAFTFMIINSIKELYAQFIANEQVVKEQARKISSIEQENLELKARVQTLEKNQNEAQELKKYLCQKDSSASFCH